MTKHNIQYRAHFVERIGRQWGVYDLPPTSASRQLFMVGTLDDCITSIDEVVNQVAYDLETDVESALAESGGYKRV